MRLTWKQFLRAPRPTQLAEVLCWLFQVGPYERNRYDA